MEPRGWSTIDDVENTLQLNAEWEKNQDYLKVVQEQLSSIARNLGLPADCLGDGESNYSSAKLESGRSNTNDQ